MRLVNTGSPIHIVLGLPAVTFQCFKKQPLTTLWCIICTVLCLLIVANMAMHYYYAVTVSPGTVERGLSVPERRKGAGSTHWWRLARQRVYDAARYSPVNATHKCGENDVEEPDSTFRFCQKCAPVFMYTALAMLPTELRANQRRNRMAMLRPEIDPTVADEIGTGNKISCGSYQDSECDEGDAEVRAWLGEQEAMRIVPPPKPERAHHCKACKACVLKYVRLY